ncbi:hypothetical protein [Oceanithermus sp.]
MMKSKKFTLILALVAGLSFAGAALAQAGTMPNLPEEIQAALDQGAIVAILDADGVVIWESDGGAVLDPTVLEAAAAIAIYDADGNLIAEYDVVLGPNGQPLVVTEDGTFGIGKFIKWALELRPAPNPEAMTGMGPQDGQQNCEQNQNREQMTERHDAAGNAQEAPEPGPHTPGQGSGGSDDGGAMAGHR